jgi:hypothetical protein
MELVIGYASSVLMCSGKKLAKLFKTQHPSYFQSLTSVPSIQIQSRLKFQTNLSTLLICRPTYRPTQCLVQFRSSCGASSQIATGVKNGLLPEIEGFSFLLRASLDSLALTLSSHPRNSLR